MDKMLADAKRLVQKLSSHDTVVDTIIGESTGLQMRLSSMRQYHDEVKKMNETADHRPRSTLILGSQLENQRIQALEHENRELSLSLAEHQSALELIMEKYRKQVLVMMQNHRDHNQLVSNGHRDDRSVEEVLMREKIAEMAGVMHRAALIDESSAAKEIESLRCLQIENDNLRELLQISRGGGLSNKNKPLEDSSKHNNSSVSLFSDSNVSFEQVKSHQDALLSKDSGIYEIEERNGFAQEAEEKLQNEEEEESDSMNCFRAIISNIEPLDVEEELSDKNDDNMNRDSLEDEIQMNGAIEFMSDSEVSDSGSDISVINTFDVSSLKHVSSNEMSNGIEELPYKNISKRQKRRMGLLDKPEEKKSTKNPLEYLFTQPRTNNDNSINDNSPLPDDPPLKNKTKPDNPMDFLFKAPVEDIAQDVTINNCTSQTLDLTLPKPNVDNSDLSTDEMSQSNDISTSEQVYESDVDSELTFTGDDIDDVMSGFDSILDDEDIE